jgi:hypothetical protein
VVEVGQNGFHDAAHHAHTHLVSPALKFLENPGEGVDELSRIEEVKLNHVLGGLGLVENDGKIGFGGHFEDIPAVDVEVILSNLFANQAPKL